ncbi:MAG: hypothetical protein MRY74_06840 [Neomegalonema sp.]|nr:hypothetical protein [Neomegalonema sp.]
MLRWGGAAIVAAVLFAAAGAAQAQQCGVLLGGKGVRTPIKAGERISPLPYLVRGVRVSKGCTLRIGGASGAQTYTSDNAQKARAWLRRNKPNSSRAFATCECPDGRKAGDAAKKAEREKKARERAERKKTAERDKAKREKAERDKAKRERAERAKAERERAERDRAERERAERDEAERPSEGRKKRESRDADRKNTDEAREPRNGRRAERDLASRDRRNEGRPRLSRRGDACILYRRDRFDGRWLAYSHGARDRLGRRFNGRVRSIEVARGCRAEIDLRDAPYSVIFDRSMRRIPPFIRRYAAGIRCTCRR